jgi:sugar phosphate isomerase/epimerase
MSSIYPPQADRREFLKQMGLAAGTASLVSAAPKVDSKWKKQIGLELFTVRGLLTPEGYEPTLAKLAAMGYKEVEPADPYNKLQPKEYKALLDKYGLKMFSTHADATEGPDLEKELEGQALMGIKYTAVRAPRPAGPNRPPVATAPGAAATKQGEQRAPMQRPPMTVESVKQSAARMNKFGQILKKFGMKYYIHNHAGEFELLDDGKTTQYDILLAETDPGLVAMQLDIGWACMAGQDVFAMFKKNPGRYELWHVKDAKYKQADPSLTPNARARASKIVTMGEGDIDYRAVFAQAKQAGLKYFVIEQDTAGQGGRDVLEDCKIACQNLQKILS